MTIVAPSTGARVRRDALTAIEAGVPADSCSHDRGKRDNSGGQPVGQLLAECGTTPVATLSGQRHSPLHTFPSPS